MKFLILFTIAVGFLLVGIILLKKELKMRKASVLVKGKTIGYVRNDNFMNEPLYSSYYLNAVFQCPFTKKSRVALSSTATSNPQHAEPSREVKVLVQKYAPYNAKIFSFANFALSATFLLMGFFWLMIAIVLVLA